jgi:hypothetical protein
MKFIAQLFAGPLDIVGDVHGEIEALTRLLDKLGYDADGCHPDGRRLVFVGDLTDRGPDSVAVIEQVAEMVVAGRAQCVLGNHELNLLRDVPKHGNDWWSRPDEATRLPSTSVTPAAKARLLNWLATLPLALERDDLRVVHACWHHASIDTMRALPAASTDVLPLYRHDEDQLRARWREGDNAAALRAEWQAMKPDFKDQATIPPFMPIKARMDEDFQMGNPISVLTSGVEQPAPAPFWAGGSWRMVERVKWWERYEDAVPVIVGHYWRRYSDMPTTDFGKFGPDLFDGIAPHHWMGARRNVYCVDFSVGGRAEQRFNGEATELCQLAALRVPEWQVVHDDGDHWEIGAP